MVRRERASACGGRVGRMWAACRHFRRCESRAQCQRTGRAVATVGGRFVGRFFCCFCSGQTRTDTVELRGDRHATIAAASRGGSLLAFVVDMTVCSLLPIHRCPCANNMHVAQPSVVLVPTYMNIDIAHPCVVRVPTIYVARDVASLVRLRVNKNRLVRLPPWVVSLLTDGSLRLGSWH